MEKGKADLRRIPLLASVSKETLKRIERQAKQLSFKKGQEIVARTEDVSDVFMMISGLARVTVISASGKAVNFRRVDPGDIFGEFSAIDGQKRSASVEATEPCTA